MGSIRVVLNSTNTVISAQDYDCWGYLLEGRTYESVSSVNQRYKFTGKERDKDLENNYDYFGVRYYDSRIGRWGGVEPLLDKYVSWSPYNYGLCNPIILKDVNGLDVFVAFSGWGMHKSGEIIDPSEYSPTSETGTNVLLYDLQKTINDNNINDFDIRGYYASSSGSEIEEAFNFIKQNLENSDEKVYLYGYSMGGINIVELADMLGEAGISVELLFTIDADKPFTGSEQNIPSNVIENWNFYQTNKELPFFSSGSVNKAFDLKKTTILNIKKSDPHMQMDEETGSAVLRKIYGSIIK